MKKFKHFNNFYSLKRINLEKLSLKHLDDIHEYSINEKFFKHFERQKINKKEQTKKYISSKIREVKNFKALWWSVALKNTNKIIGTICVNNINYARKSFEIGYGINPDYWGKGYFTEAIKGLLKNVLKKNKFLRCQAITSINNNSSIRTLIKCGFKKEGQLKKFLRNNKQKKNFDAVILAKTI